MDRLADVAGSLLQASMARILVVATRESSVIATAVAVSWAMAASISRS